MVKSERRLAAIMFTDVVGYTALTQSDESTTFELLESEKELLRPIFASHGGREVKTIGDGFLVEFNSALDATLCAISIQGEMNDRKLSRGEKLKLRIGIHLGDVIESENDVYGDAVNIASRVEPLSEPGGVCVSGQVHDQVHNKVPYHLVKLETQVLKNVAEPIDIFKVVLPWEKEELISKESKFDAHRVAILPLVSLSSDLQDEFFADGLTEELIDRLSQVKELEVIARTSVMVYKKKEKKAAEIGRELKVGSLVEGSVRKAGNKIRVTAQLVDTNTESHLWSSRYDKELQDVFAVQSDIAEQVADSLRVRLLPSERMAIEKKTTESTEAFTLCLKGRYFWNKRTKEDNNRALRYFEEAIKLDQKCALAFAGMADCYHYAADYKWLVPKEGYQKTKLYAMKAIELDPALSEAHAALGAEYFHYDWKWKEAEEELTKAIAQRPSYASAHDFYSVLLVLLLRFDESYEAIKRAHELDPLSRDIAVDLGNILSVTGRQEEAVNHLEKIVRDDPDFPDIHSRLGFAYFRSSRNEEALFELRKAVELSQGDPELLADLAETLGRVGKREEAEAMLKDLEKLSEKRYLSKVTMACVYESLGKLEKAFENLELAYSERESGLAGVRAMPGLSELRKDPRWVAIEKRMGFPTTTNH